MARKYGESYIAFGLTNVLLLEKRALHYIYIYIYIYKVKRSRYRSGVTQTVGRCVALLFHDSGTRRG